MSLSKEIQSPPKSIKSLIDLPYVELDDHQMHRWIYGCLAGQDGLMFLYEWIA